MLGQSLWKRSRKIHKTAVNYNLATKEQLSFPRLSYQLHRKRLNMFITKPWDVGRPPRRLPQFLQLSARSRLPTIPRALAITHENLDQIITYRLFNDTRVTPVLLNITKTSSQYTPFIISTSRVITGQVTVPLCDLRPVGKLNWGLQPQC